MKQLLEEVRVVPVGVSARTRIAGIYDRSVTRVERGFARDLVNEIEGIPVPFCGQNRRADAPSAGQDRPVSRIDRLLDNIETSQFGQQRQRQRRADARRSSDTDTSAHLTREVARRSTEGSQRGDIPRAESQRADTSRVDIPRVDIPRVDIPRVDIPRVDTPGVDTPRVDTSRDDRSSRHG